MDLIKITGILNDNSEEIFYIDYKNKMLYVLDKMPCKIEAPFSKERGIQTKIQGIDYVGYKFDRRKISSEINAETTFFASEYNEKGNKKREYWKDLLSGIEIGKPIVFFREYEDKNLKEALAEVSTPIVSASAITMAYAKRADIKFKTLQVYDKESVLFRCKEILNIEFVQELGKAFSFDLESNNKDQSSYTTNEILKNLTKNYLNILDSGKSDRLKLEDIRKETIKAVTLNRITYPLHSDYGKKLKERNRDGKQAVEAVKKENEQYRLMYNDAKNKSLGKRLFGKKEKNLELIDR